ncbi:MAG: hypothetical protein GY861_21880 [bacterium]|nr:hypothetical protein [bacterium]
MSTKLFCIMGVTIMLMMGCSTAPVYETTYSYTPPASQEGKTCTAQCEYSKLQCEELEDKNKELCAERAERNYDDCQEEKEEKKDDEGYQGSCFNEAWKCSADYERCEKMYRACFQVCGGTVDSDTRCIRNCEQQPE